MCVLEPNYSMNSTEKATRVEKCCMFQETGNSCHERLKQREGSIQMLHSSNVPKRNEVAY